MPQAHEVIDGARDVTLETSDGLRLGAWFVPARASPNGITVLVANGNAGDRSLRAPLARRRSRPLRKGEADATGAGLFMRLFLSYSSRDRNDALHRKDASWQLLFRL